jgi:hypothetical protein
VRGRASSYEYPSDTSLLVDACVARVRELARLDEDVVLPPLPRVAPRRDVVILTKEDMAGRAAGSPASRAPGASAGDALGAGLGLDIERISPRSGLAPRRSRGALVHCALVACSFAVAAFLASPAGHRPDVVRVTSFARVYASHAAHSVADAARSIAH